MSITPNIFSTYVGVATNEAVTVGNPITTYDGTFGNQGICMDITTGVYTVPFDGLFSIGGEMLSINTKAVVYKNGTLLGPFNAVYNLSKGDSIDIRFEATTVVIGGVVNPYSSYLTITTVGLLAGVAAGNGITVTYPTGVYNFPTISVGGALLVPGSIVNLQLLNVNVTDINGGLIKSIFSQETPTATYAIVNISTAWQNCTNFSGGGGDRSLQFGWGQDSSGINLMNGIVQFGSLSNIQSNRYSLANGNLIGFIEYTGVPSYNTPSSDTFYTDLCCSYYGGTTDYTSGLISLNIQLVRITV